MPAPLILSARITILRAEYVSFNQPRFPR